MFILRQTSVKMAVLLHKQAKVPFILIIAVHEQNRVIWYTVQKSVTAKLSIRFSLKLVWSYFQNDIDVFMQKIIN